MNPQQGQDLSALRAIMQQRGINASILDQQTSGSPGANPNMVPPSVSPQGSPMPSGMAPQAPQMAQAAPNTAQPTPGLPVGNPEAQTILKALSSRLSTISKLEEGKTGGM